MVATFGANPRAVLCASDESQAIKPQAAFQSVWSLLCTASTQGGHLAPFHRTLSPSELWNALACASVQTELQHVRTVKARQKPPSALDSLSSTFEMGRPDQVRR